MLFISLQAFANSRLSFGAAEPISKFKKIRELTEESLELQPLSDAVVSLYFLPFFNPFDIHIVL